MKNMMNVVCINERESFPGQITVGEEYTIDRNSIYIDCDGDAYGEVYHGERCIGNMSLSHFDGDFMDEIDDPVDPVPWGDYYYAEMEEMRRGTHPSQVLDRIKSRLEFLNVHFQEVTFLEWNNQPFNCVEVSLDGEVYGVFNYMENTFLNED